MVIVNRVVIKGITRPTCSGNINRGDNALKQNTIRSHYFVQRNMVFTGERELFRYGVIILKTAVDRLEYPLSVWIYETYQLR
ncbi:MAG: hypothetical protein ACI8XC_000573 [Gammaproteobacteria bacterium]|jgi:hypothetical protein